MDVPRIGVSLPTFGRYAGPDAVVDVARAVERCGLHSVSASERLLLPADPDWRNDAGLPESYVWDTLEMLAWAAADTERIRVVPSIVNALFQPPIVLARRLATLDRLSGGRVDAGLGQGWLPEEFAATGVPMARRGAGFEEHIAAMRACWGPDPVEYTGSVYRIPRSNIGPKPAGGRVPVFVGAVARPAVERAARIADGFITAVVDWDASGTEIQWYRDAGGRGPVLVRVMGFEPDLTPSAFVDDAIVALERAAEAGADEVHFEMNLVEVPPDGQVAALEALAAKLTG